MKDRRLSLWIIVFLIMTVSLITVACSGDATENTTASQTTTDTAEPTKMPTHSPSPTAVPTPSPEPQPSSVYIPREKLPDGQLFEQGYYAVLEGEGAFCHVYDCFGRIVGTFKYISDNPSLSGIFSERELAAYYRIGQDEVSLVEPVGPESNFSKLQSYANGYYQSKKDGSSFTIILYDTAGRHTRTITYKPEKPGGYAGFDVSDAGKETLVGFCKYNDDDTFSVDIYFVDQQGKIVDTCRLHNYKGMPFGLVGRKYFAMDWNGATRLVDENGVTVVDGISGIQPSDGWIGINEMAYIAIGDYFSKEGVIYNASLEPVLPGTTRPDGTMIQDVIYDIQGISCIAGSYWHEWSRGALDIFAVGVLDGKIAIKTRADEFVFASNGYNFSNMNQQMLLLTNAEATISQLRSLKTGAVLRTFENKEYVNLGESYAVAVDDHGKYSYIIDQDGNTRYVTSSSQIQVTAGEYIVLRRGPYVGIADLNGEWILKTLAREMKRDAG